MTENGALVRQFTYDDNGNRTRFDDVEHGTTTTGTYDAQDRLLSYGAFSYTYTQNGELRTKTDTSKNQTTTYAYDALGNLTHVDLPDGRAIDYIVDGMGRRVGKKINGVLVKGWLYAGKLRPVAEFDGGGNVVSRFVYATSPNVPEYVVRGGVTYRVVIDHLGSPRMLVNSATGVVAENLERDEFGNVTSDSNPGMVVFGFAGGVYDQDTGLVRFGVRDYDTQTGRWTNKDVIRFSGRSTDLYQYVEDDPINQVDPMGLVIIPASSDVADALALLEANPETRGMVDELEEASAKILIQDFDASNLSTPGASTVRRHGGACTFEKSGDFNVYIDLAFINRVTAPKEGVNFTMENVVAHELGHVYGVLLESIPLGTTPSETFAIEFENLTRWGGPYRTLP